jgi:uncharacterized protein (TIGR03790 family)
VNKLPLLWLGLVLLLPAFDVKAGGSGLNVAVIVNQNSTNSVQLGNYYRQERQVPPQNYLRINWIGGNTEWTLSDFTNTLLNPFLTMLASRQLTNQIDYVVLSMEIPYRVSDTTNGYCSTTSALFYGFKPDSRDLLTCPLADGSTNLYAGSEGIFRDTPPISAASNYFLVTMITASNLDLAMQTIRQGVMSDGTFPTQTAVLVETTDTARNVRYAGFDNAIFNTRLRGNYSIERVDAFTNASLNVIVPTNLLGYQTGYSFFDTVSNSFVPGAMADNLTSFGGQIFENSGQTPILSFLAAGATGSFGTVVEPCNYTQKFPDPQNYFYQARGFSLAECYYQSVTNPYQGLVMGEPLAAPFAHPASGSWTGLATNAVLRGTTNLSLHFVASDALHPVQQVDLFLDGNWLETVTNIAPSPGDTLNVTIRGNATNYVVPNGSTIASIASGLAIALNSSSYQNSTEVLAFLHGDRIELQSTNGSKTGAQIPVVTSTSGSNGSPATFIHASGATFLDSIAAGLKSYEISNTPSVSSYEQLTVTKTNGAIISVAVTNTANGSLTQLTQQLLDLVNATPGLETPDGIFGENLQTGPFGEVYFNLVALSGGYGAAQIQASLTVSPDLVEIQNPDNTLTDNLSDLVPRNHLYITAGVTNLSLSFPFNTAAHLDGYHELAAVAYEGSHVRTEARATQSILIQNTPLSATLTTLVGGTNTALEATLQFAVTANTGNINTIRLFSTGGLLVAVTNQFSAMFSIAATNLGIGTHPFYALVTDNSGRQYRTQTSCINIVGLNSPILLEITAPPVLLSWNAAGGRSYDILSGTNAAGTYQTRATVIPTNSTGQWPETNNSPAQQFYRIRVTP